MERKYKAFLGYSRSDGKVAAWLHRTLDRYRTPRALIGTEGAFGPIAAQLHPIFRDVEDLAGGGQLSERLKSALDQSEVGSDLSNRLIRNE
jgi:hypothetical protein